VLEILQILSLSVNLLLLWGLWSQGYLTESVQNKLRCVTGCILLYSDFVGIPRATGPIRYRLDQNPFSIGVLSRGVQPRAFHLSADGFGL
jgi:hypothetical protein